MVNNDNTSIDPRPYMQIAIEEMNKSIKEPRGDDKIQPKVGAILLFPDGRTIRSHRGELRDGDHAEFSLLERKLGNEKLDGCTLFTTLEPCVQRNHPKMGCSKRTVNTRIKNVYVGIQDPDPTVAGEGIKNMESHGVKVNMFDKDLQKIIEKENEEFLEQALHRALKVEKRAQTQIKDVIKTADFTQLSKDALQLFISDANLQFEIDDDGFKNYLSDIGVIKFIDEESNYKPTGMGLLLFGNNPRSKYPQAGLKCSADYGDGESEFKEFDQPLIMIPKLVENWLKKVLPTVKDRSEVKRKDISKYPIEPILEAVINALVHRDYEIKGAHSNIHINHEKIIVKSPGAQLPAISLDQLNRFQAPSLRRNPVITYVFSLMDFMEESGLGMHKFQSLHTQHHLPLPEYQYESPFLTLTLPRNKDAERAISDKLNKLNDEELVGFDWVKLQGEVSKKEYADHFGFDDKKAQRNLVKLKELGLVIQTGSGPSTRYIINL